MSKTINGINHKIEARRAMVVTADEMTRLVKAIGPERAAEQVDVVTTGTFGAMCSSGVFLNFGHSEPPIRMARVWLNDVEAYAGVAAVDAYLGATQASETLGMEYGGAHVIEDLLCGRPVVLRAISTGTDCYPRKEIICEITLEDLNQALMFNPRNGYQRYNAAANSSPHVLHTYMGKLLPGLGNVTFSGAGELSPLMNDPEYATIGIGTRVFLGGGVGTIVGPGTQHNPANQFGTLMVQGDLKKMSPEFLKAAVFHGYGCSLYVGLGIPIPVLDAEVARRAGISDAEITTSIIDYSVASRNRPVLKQVNYAELKSGRVDLHGKPVPAAPLASFAKAMEIASALKEWIVAGRFSLAEPAERLARRGSSHPMVQSEPQPRVRAFYRRQPRFSAPAAGETVSFAPETCIHCGQCLGICPESVFSRSAQWRVAVTVEKCSRCGLCADVCPVGAIGIQA